MSICTRRSWRAAAVVATIVAAVTLPAAGASAAPAQAAADTTGNARGTSQVSATAQAAGRAAFGADATKSEALAAYWTPARMRAAVPADQNPQVRAAAKTYAATIERQQQAGVKPASNDGPQRSAPGKVGRLGALTTTGRATTQALAGGAIAAGFVYNPNFAYNTPAAYTQGKVFFSMGGVGYVCSASIVNSEGADQVWTAGHCVHGGQGGAWATNWTFVPAYDDDLANPAPYGYWSASYLTSRTAWINSSDFSQDFGVAVMNTLNGWHIVNYFGGQGITVNKGKSGTFEYAFGYTSYGGYDGGNVLGCYGSTSPEWDLLITWSQTVQIPCGLNRGASGGPWWTSWNGSWGYLNGVNSRVDSYASPTVVRTGYFDDDAWSLWTYNRYA